MKSSKEIEDQIKALENGSSLLKAGSVARKTVDNQISVLKKELANLSKPVSGGVLTENEFLQTLLSTFSATMQSGAGTGVDSKAVRDLIENYLTTDKVKLIELDESVLNEIKANQKIFLELPNYSKPIEIDKATSDIPHFYEIIDDVLAGNNVYLIGEAGGGKAQPLSAKILSEKGWVTFEDVKVGDKVWGQDGNLYEVDGVYDRGRKNVYGITMNDGGYTETCDEHLWKIYTRSDRSKKRKGCVLPLSDFKDKIKTKKGFANAFIDVANAVHFPEKKHKIDSYLMGVIIGDGSITQGSISISNPSQEMFDSLVVPDKIKLVKRNGQKCLTYGLTRDSESGANVLKDELERFSLFGKKSVQKFIPKEYLFDSIENRVSLLQGLNDTDGYSDDSHFEFSTSSERLACDYIELVRSIGGTAKASSRIPTFVYEGERKNGEVSFRVHCVFPDNIEPFKLSYKKERYRKPVKYKTKRFIDSVTFKGIEAVRCISVTNPKHLYITDDYIVTHNTYTAEKVAETLKTMYVTLNCSQYTSPLEILGGQSVEGFKKGKLIDCWENGKILILDEMPKLDPNTAGLFNDALAKSSRTKPKKEQRINSANTEQAPIERNDGDGNTVGFGLIATGNIYPNEPPAPQYRGNNQQDLSLLDRFSGSVYYTEFSPPTDQRTTRFNFLYNFLVGNYYEYIKAKINGTPLPKPEGLRTHIESLQMKAMALVSYRTNTSFRVGFEYELVREIARRSGSVGVQDAGKTLAKTFESYMVAFLSQGVRGDAYLELIKKTGYTQDYINNLAKKEIDKILTGETGFLDSLNPLVKSTADPAFQRYSDFYVAERVLVS